jgi:hypothetical protein
MVGGTLYLSTPFNEVIALESRDRKEEVVLRPSRSTQPHLLR